GLADRSASPARTDYDDAASWRDDEVLSAWRRPLLASAAAASSTPTAPTPMPIRPVVWLASAAAWAAAACCSAASSAGLAALSAGGAGNWMAAMGSTPLNLPSAE